MSSDLTCMSYYLLDKLTCSRRMKESLCLGPRSKCLSGRIDNKFYFVNTYIINIDIEWNCYSTILAALLSH
jgi:hypothetical protein